MPLQQRENDVLNTIIESYISTATPVGSRAVSKSSGLKLSPASMRNTMADLTDKGYLEQPHTSAGRIPTAKAFRLYVDTMLRLHPLSNEEKENILTRLTGHGLEISQMLRQASTVVSSLSKQLSLILAPGGNDARWRRIDFSKLSETLILAVLILDGGLVRNRVVQVDSPVNNDELTMFSNYLNTHFTGFTLSEARIRILHELKQAENKLEQLCSRALGLARLAFEEFDEERELFVDGTLTMLDQAEFADSARMRELLSLLEEKTRLLNLIDNTMRSEETTVIFGQDSLEALDGYSVISAPYGGEVALGTVSVIGPVRMDYNTVLPVVNCISQSLSTLLKDRFAV